MDEHGSAPDDLVAQTVLAYEHVRAVLAEFGATLDNVVEETVFVTDMAQTMSQVQEIFAARASAYGQRPDVTQTLVGVPALGRSRVQNRNQVHGAFVSTLIGALKANRTKKQKEASKAKISCHINFLIFYLYGT